MLQHISQFESLRSMRCEESICLPDVHPSFLFSYHYVTWGRVLLIEQMLWSIHI